MEDLINMIISDESPSEISDKIKEILFSKSSEKIDDLKPAVAAASFDIGDSEGESEEFED
jgi:hypothetical protein